MIRLSDLARKQLVVQSKFGFAGLSFGKKRANTKSDLPKYDVVIVGANLGAVLSTHLDAVVKEKASIMVCYDSISNHYYPNRGLYEQGKTTRYDMYITTKNGLSKHNASSDNIGVEKFNPQKNEITLRNGRTIGYENLVIATGQKDNPDSIKGFQDAWSDLQSNFHTNADHSSWRSTANKPFRYHYNFNGGQAIYYIPPAPYHGSLQSFNFLLSKSLWDRHAAHGKISWDFSKFTIINANDQILPHYAKGDQFFKTQAEKKGINIENGLKLLEVKKGHQTAVFQNLKTGEITERVYGNFFSLLPAKPHDILAQAGLADSTGFLNVDKQTLQHKKYDNIFGLGDVNNLPVTKTFYGGLQQVHVLRHNLERKINGLSLNAKYNGFSQGPVLLSPTNVTWISHLYDGADTSSGIDTNPLTTWLKYKKYTMLDKKDLANLYKFKNWGPPYYKIKKTFNEPGSSSTPSANAKLHPEKKQA